MLRRLRRRRSPCGGVGGRTARRRRRARRGHLGAHVGEHHRRERRRADAGHLDDLEAGEGSRHALKLRRCGRQAPSSLRFWASNSDGRQRAALEHALQLLELRGDVAGRVGGTRLTARRAILASTWVWISACTRSGSLTSVNRCWPGLTAGLDQQIAAAEHALDHRLVEDHVVDPLERDLDPVLGEHAGAEDDPVAGDHEVGREPLDVARRPAGSRSTTMPAMAIQLTTFWKSPSSQINDADADEDRHEHRGDPTWRRTTSAGWRSSATRLVVVEQLLRIGHGPNSTVNRMDAGALLAGSRRRPAPRRHHRVAARRGGRRRRLGQDASAHPARRLPGRDGQRRGAAHARADVHPRGGGRAPAPTAPTRPRRAHHRRHVPRGGARHAAAALARPRPAPAIGRRPTATGRSPGWSLAAASMSTLLVRRGRLGDRPPA